MKHYLYIDESGDHGLSNINPNFPVFLLCGVLFNQGTYESLRQEFNELKTEIWLDKKVIFHSRDIRKCEKEFQVLFDMKLKAKFYKKLNQVISNSQYKIIASAINKNRYIKQYGRLGNDVYELSLSFIIERAVFYLDSLNKNRIELNIVIEKRGKKEDRQLHEHFQRLLARGTGFVSSERLKNYNIDIDFKDKRDNINGLQLADLIAYPVARYVIDPKRANPSFEVFQQKFYSKNGKRYGLKIFP
ncbi:DUF3800 domain-containing protein [Crocinitomix algicola]|uniref:DUF3800 domain-containing protein n=1 Tax=Crocinitomix algicola TaxID=1740263 RepID=UPI00087212B8|nr:DUF3800 domain-containing protein [Crocinitomix algicola]